MKIPFDLEVFHQKQMPLIKVLCDSVKQTKQRIEKQEYQLQQISPQISSQAFRRQKREYLKQNQRLQPIATDLLERLQAHQKSLPNELLPASLIQQYCIEVDLLNEMHYRVARTYAGFIHLHYNTVLVSMNQMAA